MQLTLEQILEEFPDKNFICISDKTELGIITSINLFSEKPECFDDLGGWGHESGSRHTLYIESKLLDYTGGWRDSLRSREDIKKVELDIQVNNFFECFPEKMFKLYHCSNCDWTITRHDQAKKGSPFYCENCGIKLNWVDK